MILAHAFGQRYELPIPLLIFAVGGGVVVAVSFLLVAARPVASSGERPVIDTPTLGRMRLWPGSASTVVLAALLVCGFRGSQVVAENILPTLFWLIVWIAVPLSVGVLGDWTRPVNPFAFLARIADQPRLRRALLGPPSPSAGRHGWAGGRPLSASSRRPAGS